jgi:hypothetical protein
MRKVEKTDKIIVEFKPSKCLQPMQHFYMPTHICRHRRALVSVVSVTFQMLKAIIKELQQFVTSRNGPNAVGTRKKERPLTYMKPSTKN